MDLFSKSFLFLFLRVCLLLLLMNSCIENEKNNTKQEIENYKLFYPSGVLQVEASLKNGYFHRVYKKFYENIEIISHYQEGLVKGRVKKFYPNGSLGIPDYIITIFQLEDIMNITKMILVKLSIAF